MCFKFHLKLKNEFPNINHFLREIVDEFRQYLIFRVKFLHQNLPKRFLNQSDIKKTKNKQKK